MDIHHYHPTTGAYLGAGTADPDPLEPGRFLIPAHATSEAPPAAGTGKIAVRAGGAWTLAEDHRGETVYETATGLPSVIADLGPLPAGATAKRPPSPTHTWDAVGEVWVWPLGAAVADRAAAAKAVLDAKLAEGWRDAAGVVWSLGQSDQLNTIAVNTRIALGRGLPGGGATLGKSDLAGVDRALDAAGWTALGVGMSDRIAALVGAYKAHVGALDAIAAGPGTDAAKRAAIAARDLAAGWPAP